MRGCWPGCSRFHRSTDEGLLAQRLVATWPTTARRRRRGARPASAGPRGPRPAAEPENRIVARRDGPVGRSAATGTGPARSRRRCRPSGIGPASGSSRCRASGSRRRPRGASGPYMRRMPCCDDGRHLVGERRVVGLARRARSTPAAGEWPSWCCRPSPSRVVRPAVAPSRKPRPAQSPHAQIRSPTRWKPNIE